MSDDFIHELVETGFERIITATVNDAAAGQPLTAEAKDALKAFVPFKPEQTTPTFLVSVARDIAIDVDQLSTTLKKHNLTEAQYDYLAHHNEFFKKALVQQAHEWQSLSSTQARLKAQAAAALETQLPTIASRMGQASEKLADVVEAAKLFAKIADVDRTDANGPRAGGEGFTITIDLGADDRLTLRSGQAPGEGTKTVGASTVSGQPAGQGSTLPVLDKPGGITDV